MSRSNSTPEWRKLSGPGTVEFDDSNSATTPVTFPSTGRYELELAAESTPQLVGLRFTDLAIPSGSTITRAWVQFTVDETRSYRTTYLTIHGESAADAVSFDASLGNLSSRPLTATTVDWSPPAWERIDDVGEAQRTPDLSAIVQEIVDGNGWQSGHSLVLLIDGDRQQRVAESFDGERNSAPLLYVEYQ